VSCFFQQEEGRGKADDAGGWCHLDGMFYQPQPTYVTSMGTYKSATAADSGWVSSNSKKIFKEENGPEDENDN
jgi:hypothetical protein